MIDATELKLPHGWTQTSLGEIVEPRTGKANPKESPEAKFIGMEQVEPHTMRLLGTVPAITMKSGANTFQPFDVLYGRMRAYLNKVYQPDFSGLCSGEFIVLPETIAVLGRFLKYRLNSSDFVRFANHLNTGDRPRVDFDQIKVFALLLPPKPEQERIADRLDELLSDLDAGVAALERVQAKLKLYRASVLKAAVEGGLTVEWRKQNPTDGMRVFASQNHEVDFSTLPHLPENWVWSVPLEFCEVVASGSTPVPEKMYEGTGEIPFLKVYNLTFTGKLDFTIKPTFIDETSHKKQARSQARPGDVLINIVGPPLGKVAIVPNEHPEWNINQAIVVFRPKTGVNNKYLAFALMTDSIMKRVTSLAKSTAGQFNIGVNMCRNLLPIPIPPKIEQDVIVEVVEEQLSVIDHLEADLEAKLTNAQALRQSILRHAFTGQLVPQDPNDEPAAELLKRIAAQRDEFIRKTQIVKKSKPSRPKNSKG